MPKGVWEVFKEFGIALGTDIVFKKFTSATADKASEYVAEKVFADKRAELLGDLMSMHAADTDNLWRWHREATAELRENRFVSLLCKIPKEIRKDVLEALNHMDDNEFQQALNLLEHDIVVQAAKRTAAAVSGGLEAAAQKATPHVDALNRRLAERIRVLEERKKQRGG